jgi:hypothetical protein
VSIRTLRGARGDVELEVGEVTTMEAGDEVGGAEVDVVVFFVHVPVPLLVRG